LFIIENNSLILLPIWEVSTLSWMKDWSPLSAAEAVAWLTEQQLPTACETKVLMPWTRSLGPATQPMRKPVIVQFLETPLIASVRCFNSGAALRKCGLGVLSNRICS
jgi:hypothetical protein